MDKLIEELLKIHPDNSHFIVKPNLIEGYSDDELKEIETRYNLTIQGQLREWLSSIGKNSGGLLLGSKINIYNPISKPLSEYFGKQLQEAWQDRNDYGFFLDLIGNINLVEKQFFLLADDEQIYFYFMLTNDKNDIVYLYFDGEADKQPSLKVYGTLFDFLKNSRKYTSCNITGENEKDFYRLTTGRLL